MSLAEYLEGCRNDPMMYASAPERILAAIGEPELVDTVEGRAPRPHLHEPHDPGLSGLRRILRHGGDDRADRRLLPPRRAGPGGAQADPLPARPRRRRQILARRAAEGADGGQAHLRAEGRRRDQPGLREPARPVRSRAAWAPMLEERYGIPRAPADRPHEPLGDQAARRVRRRHLASSAWSRSIPSRLRQIACRQDRAGRREQPGHLVAGRQGRHPQARDALPERSRRLQLFRRPQPREPGPSRIRRDVQGADQDAASRC